MKFQFKRIRKKICNIPLQTTDIGTGDRKSFSVLITKAINRLIANYQFPSSRDRSAKGFYNYCLSSQSYVDVFVCDSYRYCRAAKLLMALGYGNFDTVIQYDVYSMAEIFMRDAGTWSKSAFIASDFSLKFGVYDESSILNSPNLSILPLLAYHKICNDHYRNEKWQPFEPWTCNIDYCALLTIWTLNLL